MPVINGVYLKDFAALPSAVVDANIIPIAISGNQIAYRTTVGGIVTDARVTSKLLTGLSVTGGAVVATDTILQAFGKVQNQINSKVSSVGLTMPSAFSVANSPITSAGTLAVTAIGAASQYIRGDGALADFPTSGGGGSSVSYYLNGSISQGTIGGNAYYEMNKTPVIGTGTDFTINANGYIAQFITDANDPASLLIPAGNWNVEMYFSASSSGGTPSFYVEVYKYNGTTFTLLGSSATTPEGITNGTAIDIYYTSVGIPETVLTITDRLAIRVYVTHSGRTITLHTEDNHLSEIVTTFSNGLTALNGLTKQAQYFAVGSTGTDFNIASSVDTHTFNIPDASASNRGLITTGAQTIGGDKTFTSASANPTVIIKNTGAGRKFEVHNSGGSPVLYVDGVGNTTITGNLTITGGSTFDMSQTMLATGSSYFASSLSVTRFLSTQTYNIAFRTGALQTTATPNWYAGNFTGNNDFEITNYAAGANQTSLKINSTTNLVTLLGGISATTANFTGQLTLGSTITNGTYTYTLPSATGTIALVGGAGVGTVTSVAAITLGTSGTDLSSTVANGTTTPVITLNVPDASATARGVITTGTQTFAGAKTLTGALSGTSATFTGRIGTSLSSSGVNFANSSLYVNNTANTKGAIFGYNDSADNFYFTALEYGVAYKPLLFNTSAATFSSSVTAGASITNAATLHVNNTSSADPTALTLTPTTNVFGMSTSPGGMLAGGIGSTGGTYVWLQGRNTGAAGVSYPIVLQPLGGNVGIGTASPSVKLDVGGASNIDCQARFFKTSEGTLLLGGNRSTSNCPFIGSQNNYDFAIITNDTERMRITSGGKVQVTNNISDYGFTVSNSNSDGYGLYIQAGGTYPVIDTYNYTGGTALFRVSGAGVIFAQNTSVQSISDIRTKENIQNSIDGLNIINSLRPVRFDFKGGFGNNRKNQLGFIAQEVEEVFPDIVDEWKFKKDDKITYKTLGQAGLIPVLVKAIQEQQAQIEELKALIKPIEPIAPEVTTEPESETDNNLE
jgi:hypothetical protein